MSPAKLALVALALVACSPHAPAPAAPPPAASAPPVASVAAPPPSASASAHPDTVSSATPPLPAGFVSITDSPDYQDKDELARAFAMPVAATFAKAGIVYQPNGSFCGPTSIADVMRSVGTSGETPQQVVEGTDKCSGDVCHHGLSLDEVAELLRAKTGKKVTVLRDLTLAQFKAELSHVNEPDRRYIVNFTRRPLFGRGGGHHSPLGAYLPDKDLVLVIDVNEKYHPWLVKSDRLYEAMDTVDPSTNKKRGLLLVQ